MENKCDSVTCGDDVASHLLQQTLASWRFLLLFILAPLMWVVFVGQAGIFRAVIALLCGFAFFGCWRVWLDAHYLAVINQENNEQAGTALFFIWRRERLQRLTLSERRQGALKQFRRAMGLIALLWVVWLIALLFY
ncbi:hypothetical protein Q0A17_04560 [Citrobacter sp. S2-9]|uniref:Uncharacterized protein n=1 Tax=Citrobacter enshiensis TaxID=2971264 RepID=A0ABT8PQS6_9ENTR|nr:hypothetical protein [Citrobacter enshiensis]MDN8598695.1 hypothetical protein [Citrobacter enshiensis]